MVNKAIIVGNLGAAPEVIALESGRAMATASVATNQKWTDRETGEKQEKTEWHRIIFWGRTAEVAAKYLEKGSKVYIEGRLQTRKWQDKTHGDDRYTTEIVCQNLQMLGSPGGRRTGDPGPSEDDARDFEEQNPAADDIPF